MTHTTVGTILAEVAEEIASSIAKHGTQRAVPLGTGPDCYPLRTVLRQGDCDPGLDRWVTGRVAARIATVDTKRRTPGEGGDGTVSWWHILREEVFEAAAENDPAALRAELLQVAAVAVKMVEQLDWLAIPKCPRCGSTTHVASDGLTECDDQATCGWNWADDVAQDGSAR